MSELSWLGYLGILLGTASLSLVLVPVAMRVAIRFDVLDRPGGYKQQTTAVPYLGGTAITVSLATAVLAAAVVQPPVAGFAELAAILGGGVALSLVGLADDLRDLRPSTRVAAMLAAAIGLHAAGVRTDLFGELWWLDLAITVVWVLGITNAFNLLDNMDGLSAGVAAIAATFFFIIAVVNGQFLVAALSIALVGCTLGFLRHNRPPAQIYMGDTGSLFIGFLLAAIGIKLRFDAPREVTAFVPIIVLGVAILDTTLVTLTRLRQGRSPFEGARDHVSHRLVGLGLPVTATVGVVYTAAVALGAAALILSRLDDSLTAYLLIGSVLTAGVLTGVVLARWAPRQEVAGQRRETASPSGTSSVEDVTSGST